MDAILYGVAGFLFVFFTITGWELEQTGNIAWTLGSVAFVLILSLILGIVIGEGMRFLFLFLEKKMAEKQPAEEKREKAGFVWLGSFGLILLSRLPFLLAFYPGICAYDIMVQLGQVISGEYNLHHPLAHTLLLKLFYDFGSKVFGDPTTGIAWMIMGQTVLLSVAMAFGVAFFYRRGMKKGWLLFLQIYWMGYPFLPYLCISFTKDAVFAIFFLLQIVGLVALLEGKKRWQYDALYVSSSILMQFFRNNGIYAFLFLEGILFLVLLFGKTDKKLYGKLFLEGVIGLAGGLLCLSLMTKATGALQGDKREMLSVPIQQMARCMLYHGGLYVLPEDDGTMEEKDKALINDFLLYESYRSYDEKLSDPVKSNTNTYVVRYRTMEFVRMYLHLLKQYPGDLVNAFLALNAGYIYLGDESHGRIYEIREMEGLSYVHTRWDSNIEQYGIRQHSLAPRLKEKLISWANENGHLKIPVLKYLWVPAMIFWGYVLGFLNEIRKKRYRNCIPYALVAGYYATLFLGPAVQLRYLFPLLVAFPFLISLGSSGESRVSPSAQ